MKKPKWLTWCLTLIADARAERAPANLPELKKQMLELAFGDIANKSVDSKKTIDRFRDIERSSILESWNQIAFADREDWRTFVRFNRIRAWKSAIDLFRQLHETISGTELDEIWKDHQDFGERMKKDPAWNQRQQDREAFLALFNLNTGPASFVPDRRSAQYGVQPSSSERAEVPGLKVQQNVFIDGPFGSEQSANSYKALDSFALSVSEADGIEGIYCLSGARGSGKSTVLNRIEWF